LREPSFDPLQKTCKDILDILQSNNQFPPEAKKSLLGRGFGPIVSFFIRTYGNNIAEFLGHIVCLSNEYALLGIKMLEIVWDIVRTQVGDFGSFASFRVLVQKIMFIPDIGEEVAKLALFIFNDDDFSLQVIKDLDLASQGRVDKLPVFEQSPGSVKYNKFKNRLTCQWMSALDIHTSNRMYVINE
jgi:hypothetical protein